jgi:hypothetical protein
LELLLFGDDLLDKVETRNIVDGAIFGRTVGDGD